MLTLMRSWRWAGLLAMLLTTCSGARDAYRITRDGVFVHRVDADGASTHEHVQAGDFELRGARMRVVIASGSSARHGEDASGTIRIASFATHDIATPLGPLTPVIEAQGRAVTVLAGSLESALENGQAIVRWRGTMATATGVVLHVIRDAMIDSTARALVLRTQVQRASAGPPISVAAGIETQSMTGALFAAGVGLVSTSMTQRVPWIAGSGDAYSWALLIPHEAMRARVEIGRELDREPPRLTALTDERVLAGRDTLTFTTVLLGVDGDLADLSRAAWRVRGDRPVDTTLRVQAHDPLDRAFIVVTRPDGTTVLVADMARDVSRSLPLMPGDYVAYAFAHGHTPSDPIRFTAGETREPISLEIPDGGHIRVTALDRATHAAIPCRIVVRGVDGTPDPLLGPLYSAAGAGQIVIASSGHAEFTAPTGTYEITVSHGPEWTITRTRAQVTPTTRGDVTALLDHVIAMDDWTACDLHVHSVPSGDSEVTPIDRVAALVAEGIEFAAATEHNIVGDYAAGIAALTHIATPAQGGPSLVWVPAVEVTTDRSPQPVGHFNVYPYPADPRAEHGGPPPFDGTPQQIFRAARTRQTDGVIQVNHPRMEPGIGYFDRVHLDTRTNLATSPLYDPNYDAIEVFNGYFIGRPAEIDRVLHDWLDLLDSGARYVGTASSDSHAIAYLAAGYPRTYVYTPGAGDRSPDPSVVVSSLRAGHAFGSSGPMIFARIGTAMPGDTIRTTADHVDLVVEVRAAPWIDVNEVQVYRDGDVIETFAVPPGHDAVRLRQTFSVPILADRSHLVVTARGPQGGLEAALPHVNALPFAFTNPIWIEHPGPPRASNGTRRAPFERVAGARYHRLRASTSVPPER